LQLEDQVARYIGHLPEETQADVIALLRDDVYGRFARAACAKNEKVYIIIETVLHLFGYRSK
jgi:hypothetical protein